MSFIEQLRQSLNSNNGKIPASLIDTLASTAKVQYLHPTPNTRLCILTLVTGHELIGKAQVLDSANDVESIGNSIAYTDAKNQIWQTVGAIAKVLS